MDQDPDAFWADVFSRDPARIRAALGRLSREEERAVVAHLQRMAEGEGWQEGQREAARVALEVLRQPRGE